jgi:hypothetical protein
MTHQEIKELAGHRAVSPWVMKLVGDAVAKEREACAKIADQISDKYGWGYYGNEVDTSDEIAGAIRARGQA